MVRHDRFCEPSAQALDPAAKRSHIAAERTDSLQCNLIQCDVGSPGCKIIFPASTMHPLRNREQDIAAWRAYPMQCRVIHRNVNLHCSMTALLGAIHPYSLQSEFISRGCVPLQCDASSIRCEASLSAAMSPCFTAMQDCSVAMRGCSPRILLVRRNARLRSGEPACYPSLSRQLDAILTDGAAVRCEAG